MYGSLAAGSVRLMQELTGATVTMTATTTAGLTTKDTGIGRIMAIITIGTVTAAAIVIATTTAVRQAAMIPNAC